MVRAWKLRCTVYCSSAARSALLSLSTVSRCVNWLLKVLIIFSAWLITCQK